MNEQQFAEQVVRALEASAERLPYRVTHRLEMARHAALAKIPEFADQAPVEPASAPDSEAPWRERGRGWGIVLASLAASVMMLVVGFVAIPIWSDYQLAEEMADVDLAVLTDDDVPIDAYADRGFGVYLKNSHQQ